MADFQVIRRKGKKSAVEQPQELTQEDQSSLLSKAGAGAMSGLHTVGSILSWPSRLVHGAINAAVGGKEGFGENYLNPFDSRGGVEGSRHLINAGILPENNPNEWEWGDLGRGVADLALDPTTYMGPGLTKIGRAAEKGGTLAAGRIAQTANNQRALLNVGLPFSDPILSIGTGAGTAKALSTIGKKTGLTAATNAVKKSYPVRAMGALFDSRKQGLTQATAQEQAMKATEEMRKLQTATRGDINRAIRTEELAKMHQDDLRRGLEGAEKSAVEGGYVPHPAAAEGTLEPHVMLHINPQHDLLRSQYPDAIDTGVLDDVLKAGKPVTAPLLHLDDAGKPVLGKGKVNFGSKDIKSMAKKAFDDEIKALQEKAAGLPMWADPHPWQMTREEFSSHPDVMFHGSPKKGLVDLTPNKAKQWGEAVYFAKNRDVAAGDFGHGGELHAAKASPDAKLFDASNGGLPPGYKDTKAWKSYVDDLAKKYPDEDASSIAYLAEDQLAENGDVARKILQEQGYHGVVSQHPDYGVETAIFDPSKFTTHKQSVAKALKEGLPVSKEVLAEYPDLAKAVSEINDYVDWITKTGGKGATPEQIQFLKNNHAAIERELKVRKAAEQAAKNAPFSVTDVLHSHFPESMNTATVPFREITKITGKTPAEIVEALKKEIPEGYTLQPHDFPEQIVSEGRQAEHFWHPKDPTEVGSHDKPFVGFSLRPETGKAIADAKAAVNQAPVTPVASALPDLDAFLASKKNPDDWRKMLEENTDKMISQGKFHRFSAADFLNDPTHGPMNKAYIDLLKSKGYDVVNLKHNGSDSISGDLVKTAASTPSPMKVNYDALNGYLANRGAANAEKAMSAFNAANGLPPLNDAELAYLREFSKHSKGAGGQLDKKAMAKAKAAAEAVASKKVATQAPQSQPIPASFADDIAKKEAIATPDTPVAAPGESRAIHPERLALSKQADALKKARKAKIEEHAARIAAELQSQHGADDALATLAKMRDLKEPGMAVMVPKSQAEQIRRMLAGGKKERNVSDTTNIVRGSKEYEHIAKGRDEMLNRQRERGFGMGEELHDPTIDYFPRRESITAAEQAAGDVSQRGSSVMPAKTAEDTQRKWIFTGHHEGTVGINKVLKDEVLHDIAATGKVADVEAALRQRHGHMIDGLYQDKKQRAMVQKTLKAVKAFEARAIANEQKIADLNNSALAMARKSTDPEAVRAVAKQDRKIARIQKKVDAYRQKHAEALAAHEEALHAGHDRIPALAKYIKANPQLRGVDKFGNNPLVDYAHARLSNDRKYAMTNAVYGTISKELNKGDQAVTLRDFLTNKGFKLRTAAEKIAGREFEDAADLKAFLDGNTIDSKLAEQLNSLTPAFKAPAAVNELTDKLKSGMAWWKGLTLAFPASRVRDAVGGVVQNVLHGWADPRFLAEDARLLLTGKVVKRNYSHVPEIKDWLAKTGKEWSPENQTEALRQLVATYLPSEHSILADVPTGQVGAGIDQLMHNIPGLQQTTAFNQFIGDPMRALAGKDPGGASWFGRGTPDDTILSRTAKAAEHPFTGVRGVGDATETTFAPVKASEIVAANSDAYNRTAPFLQQVFGGTRADVAANKVNRAQIDYDPSTFTAFERGIKNYVAPFYSFNSRILPETARELSNFGSPTSQLIKTIDRAHAGGDASVPDYVMSGTGIPLGTRADGSKSYLTGLGQMYEPAVSQLGLLAGGITDPRSLRAAGFDTLAQLNPMIGTPLQRITGQSFFQRGEPISNLDPIAGRTLSNIGESLGLRSQDEGPVQFPGSAYLDTALGATPFGRAIGQVRTLADPRKDIASKLVDTMSGARVTDISPEKQMATLQKRAEDLARSQGAWEQRTVGFPKEQLAKLALTNPELAAEQQHLQNMITAMKRKRTIRRKEKKAAEKK